MNQVKAPVISCDEVMPGTFLLWLHAPQIVSKAGPGQFITVRCSEGFAPLLRRPLSIHRVQGEELGLLFAVVGKGTEWLSLRNAGDTLDIIGPLGNGFTPDPQTGKLLLVAGGIGIAPMVYVAEQASSNGTGVKLLAGATDRSCLYLPELKNVEIICLTDDGSYGQKGVVTDLLPSLSDWADEILACGPVPMYRAMFRVETELAQKPVRIMMEQAMACGVGACRGCAVSTRNGIRMVCSDGPVFDLDEILWNEVS